MNNKASHNLPSIQNIRSFRSKLIHWFSKNGRDYPWRRTRDPFKVLIAEMMLRRTKADQVEAVYTKLFAEFPDVQTMAEARESELARILYPLGLKWRTPAFQLVAREIRGKYDGKVPDTREELVKLPGVGDYVAGAVLSIGYSKPEWMVDSNIVRLFKRYFGIKTSKEGRRDRHVIEMAKSYVSGRDARKAHLAILDFTALVCTPLKPDCKKCPLRRGCYYVRLQLL